MRGLACGRRLGAVVTAGALFVMVAAGCGDDAPERHTSPASTAQVGPKCSALRSSKDLEYAAYSPLIDFVFVSGEGERARYDSLTRGQRMLWATRLLEDEVNNGGFNQYFWNTRGATLDDAIRGFQTFGTRAHTELARKAGEIYAKDKERLAKAQAEGTLDAFSESYDDQPHEALDSRFYGLSSPPGRPAYLRSHLRQFCLP